MAIQAQFARGTPCMDSYTPSGAAVAAGDVIVQGDQTVIAHLAIADGALGSVAVCGGIYKVVAGLAIDIGEKVYWDDTNNKVNKTNTNKPFGFARSAASADADVIYALHHPF